jgi:hypothetical protein
MVARPLLPFSIALALALAAPPSLPAGEPDPQAYAGSIAALMREGGFPQVTTVEGSLRSSGRSIDHEVSLSAGQRLIAFACGDARASDLDITITGPDGQSWQDTLSDSRPLVELTASLPGTYRIAVIAHSIDGDSCSYILLHATRN